jgi:hypothetical protein
MPIPSYGAAPLSTTFFCVRIMQVISLIIMLGLAGNAINQMAMQNFDPSREIVGTLSVVRFTLPLGRHRLTSARLPS